MSTTRLVVGLVFAVAGLVAGAASALTGPDRTTTTASYSTALLPAVVYEATINTEPTPNPTCNWTVQYVSNPSFESGWSAWSLIEGSPTLSTSTASQGQQSMAFGWRDGATDTISQTFTVPTWADSAALYFDWYLYSADDPAVPYDVLTVSLVPSGSGSAIVQGTVNNTDTQIEWLTRRESIDLSPYRGQEVAVRITGSTDITMNTGWYIDQVRLVIACGSAVP